MGTEAESTWSDGSDAVGNGDAGEMTGRKGFFPDGFNTVWYGDAGNTFTTIERAFAKGSNAVGNGDAG